MCLSTWSVSSIHEAERTRQEAAHPRERSCPDVAMAKGCSFFTGALSSGRLQEAFINRLIMILREDKGPVLLEVV